jgi:hypothetical protein
MNFHLGDCIACGCDETDDDRVGGGVPQNALLDHWSLDHHFVTKLERENSVKTSVVYPNRIWSASFWRIRIGIQGLLIRIRIHIYFNQM